MHCTVPVQYGFPSIISKFTSPHDVIADSFNSVNFDARRLSSINPTTPPPSCFGFGPASFI